VSAYYDTNEVDPALFDQDSGFVKPGSITSTERDVSGSKELIAYTVRSGDSLGLIADRFQVSSDSILWANDMSRDHIFQPGESVKIPPVTGLVYSVASKDTVDSIASRFKVDSVDILAQNQLDASTDLQIGQQLIIPGAIKEIPKPVIIPKKEDKKALVKNSSGKKNVLAQAAGGKKAPTNALSVYKR
jgi:LysM repeat protein